VIVEYRNRLDTFEKLVGGEWGGVAIMLVPSMRDVGLSLS
jgi:hypothetical protein